MADQQKLRTRVLETLESKQMLAADLAVAGACEDCVETAQVAEASVADAMPVELHSETEWVQPELPAGLPQQFTTTIEYAGQTLTLQLDKNDVFGENTRFLVDDGSGTLVQIDHGPDGTYLGTVAENPDYSVVAVLTEAGLRASISRPGQESILIDPPQDTASGLHRVYLDEVVGGHSHGEDVSDQHTYGAEGESATAASLTGAPSVAPSSDEGVEHTPSESATLAPTRVMNVYEYEVGVEISSRAFLNNYGSNLAQAQSVAQGIAGNMDSRYLNSTGIKHRVGTVIIRTNAATDPINVANGNDTPGLNAFRDYWNSNPGEVGNTHDLAVYHVQAGPSGLAYPNAVGTGNRYALSASNGPTSWADGTLAHEFGHTWSLPHVNDGLNAGLFYEANPRSNGNAAGGSDLFVSVMDGRGEHNTGRLATDEANRVYNVRQGKLGFGDLIANPGPVKPFGHRDQVEVGSDPVVIDVIANDYDVNNDALDVQLRDTISQQGGTISLSVGTGPGGRDELIYTPPVVFSGSDFFHYNVVDGTGRSDWGAVYITSSFIGIDPSQDFFSYDAGTADSPVFNSGTDAVRLTTETSGDVFWTGNGLQSVDRSDSGANAYNRDLIFGSESATFSHKVENGLWSIVLNMSDPSTNLDNMFVEAEGQSALTDIDRPIGTNTTMSFEVEVVDGELNLVFGDADVVNPLWAVNRINLTQVEAYTPPLLEGDFNGDGVVDAADYTVYRDAFGTSVATPYEGADADGDRMIGAGDRAVWAANYGASLVRAPLITATQGNGEFAFDNAGDAEEVGGGAEAIQVNVSRDRALRNTSANGRGLSIPGWDITRSDYGGSNPAFGVDGLYGFAEDAGTDPGQTGQAFVNSGAVVIASEPITRTFVVGERLDLSYLIGSDFSPTTTVEATVRFVFDRGLATERTISLATQSGTGVTTPAITEQLTVGAPASSLSVEFVLDGVAVGRRALLDQVTLDVVTTSALANATSALLPGSADVADVADPLIDEVAPPAQESETVRLFGPSAARSLYRPVVRRSELVDEALAEAPVDRSDLLIVSAQAASDDGYEAIAETAKVDSGDPVDAAFESLGGELIDSGF